MSKLSQGTQIYFIDPANNALVEVQCATTFNPGGAPRDQLDDTCLADSAARSKPGLQRPGQATIGLNADPEYASHVRLHELSEDDTNAIVQWAVGWSDGTAAPTVDTNGTFNLPATRSWYTFDGYVADFPFDFSLNTLVTSTVTIQRSGGSEWTVKTP